MYICLVSKLHSFKISTKDVTDGTVYGCASGDLMLNKPLIRMIPGQLVLQLILL